MTRAINGKLAAVLCFASLISACGADVSLTVIRATPSPSPGAAATATVTQVAAPTSTATRASTSTATVARTVTPTTVASTPTRTPTRSTPTRTRGATSTPTATIPPSRTPTIPPSQTLTASPSPTETTGPSPSATSTEGITATPTQSATASLTATMGTPGTPSPTSNTATPTGTPTATNTGAASPTSTPTRTNTSDASPTPTPTPTVGGGGACGDGILTHAETCESCAPDCQVLSCTDGGTDATFRVDFDAPAGETATSVTFLVSYKSNLLSIPESGIVPMVQQRILMRPSGSSVLGNDLDYAVRAVVTRTAGLAESRVFNVLFDVCQGATPSASDLGCIIEGCSGEFGLIQGCLCTVALP